MVAMTRELAEKAVKLHTSKRKEYTLDEIEAKTGLSHKQIQRAIANFEGKAAVHTGKVKLNAEQQRNLVHTKYGFDYAEILDRKPNLSRPSKVNIMRKVLAKNPTLDFDDAVKKVVTETEKEATITKEWTENSLRGCYRFVKEEIKQGALIPR